MSTLANGSGSARPSAGGTAEKIVRPSDDDPVVLASRFRALVPGHRHSRLPDQTASLEAEARSIPAVMNDPA